MTEVPAPVFDDLERRKLAEASLRSITLSTSRVSGDAFFRVLVKDLAEALDMHYVIAGELIVEDGDEKNRTLAIWAGNDYLPNMTYSLQHKPCSDVAGKDMCFLASCVQQEYPLDTLLVDMGAESYVGMSMVGTTGATLGILVGMDTKPIDENRRLLALSLLSIFSARCAAELQHRNREVELEVQVAQRTRALEAARDMPVQLEKLAGPGSLVAGVAQDAQYQPDRLDRGEPPAYVVQHPGRDAGRLPDEGVGQGQGGAMAVRQQAVRVLVHGVEEGLVGTVQQRGPAPQ